MSKLLTDKIKLLALEHGFRQYVSNFDEVVSQTSSLWDIYENLEFHIDNGTVDIWQPFEYRNAEEVAELIESAAEAFLGDVKQVVCMLGESADARYDAKEFGNMVFQHVQTSKKHTRACIDPELIPQTI